MVKHLRQRKSQDLWVPGLVWMMIGLPRGDRGVALKFKGALKCSQEKMAGSMLDQQSIFRVSSVSQRGLVVRAKYFGISPRGHRFRTAVSKA